MCGAIKGCDVTSSIAVSFLLLIYECLFMFNFILYFANTVYLMNLSILPWFPITTTNLVNKKNFETQKQNLAMGHYIHLSASRERHFLNGFLRHCRGIIAGAPAHRISFYITLDGQITNRMMANLELQNDEVR